MPAPAPSAFFGAVRAAVLAPVLAVMLAGPVALAQTVGSPGASFELVDQNGRPFASATLVGRPYAIFFGFTHCPDVCPTTLLEMSNNLGRLGADADRLTVVFVSVDPERDTPARLREYLSAFDPRIVALTGSEQAIADAAKGWNAFYNKVPEDDGSYTIAHSAYVYLMDADNRLADTMGFQESEAEQLEKLKRLVGAGSIERN